MPDLVGNPEDLFSHNEAQLKGCVEGLRYSLRLPISVRNTSLLLRVVELATYLFANEYVMHSFPVDQLLN